MLITPGSLNLPWIYFEMGCAFSLKKPYIPCVARGLTLLDLPQQIVNINGIDLNDMEGGVVLLRGLSHILSVKCRQPIEALAELLYPL